MDSLHLSGDVPGGAIHNQGVRGSGVQEHQVCFEAVFFLNSEAFLPFCFFSGYVMIGSRLE